MERKWDKKQEKMNIELESELNRRGHCNLGLLMCRVPGGGEIVKWV
jgi:hypothetical protein